MGVYMLKIFLLMTTTMTAAASSPSLPSRSINPHRHTTETITITVDKDSPSKNNNLADTLNSITAHRTQIKQLELRHLSFRQHTFWKEMYR